MMRKHSSKTLLVSLLAALSLMAFAAAGAQAGEIQVGGSTALATSVEVSGSDIGSETLLIKALGIEILCETGTLVGKVISGPLGTGSVTRTLSNCKIFPINAAGELTSKTALPCTVNEGKPIVAEGSGEVVLHEGRSYLLAKSAEGAPFTTIKFSGAECTLPAKNEVKGSVALKWVTGDLNVGAAVVEPEFESSDAIQELLKGELLFGKNKAFLMGKAKVKVSAPAVDIGKTIGAK